LIYGLFGPLTFARQVGVMHDFADSESINFAEHGIHLQKPRLEFTGLSLVEVSFEMEFLSGFTTEPAAGIQLLSGLLRAHAAYPLIVAGQIIGGFTTRFVITERSAAHHWYSMAAGIQNATVKVSMREYVSNPG
jgi:hypothetical protein